jgi:hypothetical protein
MAASLNDSGPAGKISKAFEYDKQNVQKSRPNVFVLITENVSD